MNVFGGTIWAIPKPPVMACRGLCSTVKAFLVALKPQKESDIINPAVVAMNSSAWVYSAVAAATGRGFKSRRPDAFSYIKMNLTEKKYQKSIKTMSSLVELTTGRSHSMKSGVALLHK